MDDGYYWATQVGTGERDIVMVCEDEVFVFMSEGGFDVHDFKDFVAIPNEVIP